MNNKFEDLLLLDNEFDEYESLPSPEISDRAKKRLNRLFREVVGSSNIPHPDVDNYYELIRSKIVRFFKVIIFRISKKQKTMIKSYSWNIMLNFTNNMI